MVAKARPLRPAAAEESTMAKSKKVARLQGSPPPGARGRTAQTTQQVTTDSLHGALDRTHRTDTNRPIGSAGGKARGDRRDTSRTYTNNERHPARGNNPRPDVKTRKR
jgi:hypothetical protein